MSRSKFVLCQDCLKVSIFSVARHNEDELCACGGQYCGCSGCDQQAREIVESNSSHVFFLLTDEQVFSIQDENA